MIGIPSRAAPLVACLLGVIGAVPASAQSLPAPTATFDPAQTLRAGVCTVVVTVSGSPGAGAAIEIDINGFGNIREEVNGRPRLEFRLPGPLEHLDNVRLREVGPGTNSAWSDPVEVGPAGDTEPECEGRQARIAAGDGRDPFRASAYVGYAYDNFAPAEVGGYKVGTETDPVSSSPHRFIAGVDFEFRMFGGPEDDRQLWLFGETLHGVQSADVDCSVDPAPPVCGKLQNDPGARLLYTFEHATSLEAFIAPRFEFMTLQRGTTFPSKLYVTMRFGVMMLTDRGSRAFDAHHFGVGLLAPSGSFRGSYLEVGWGRTDLFFTEPDRSRWNRLKIDGLLSFPLTGSDKLPRVFVQMYSDFDPVGAAADSVQTFVGLDFDIVELFTF